MTTERNQETSFAKGKQVKLRVANMLGKLQDRVLENTVFVKSKAFLGWSHVEFVRLETGFVCKLGEDNAVDSVSEVAIPSLLRSKDIYYDDPKNSLAFGDETVLTAVDPESVENASLLRVTVSTTIPIYTGHVAVNREEVIEAIHRHYRGHILAQNAVLGIVVNKKELRVQVAEMESLSFTKLKMANISVFTTVRVMSVLGLYGVTLLTETEAKANDPKPQAKAKAEEAKVEDPKPQAKAKAKEAKVEDPNPQAKAKAKADDHDAVKSSEALTSEAMRVFSALLSIIQYDAECSTPEHIDAMEDASTILGCRLKQIAKEMERRTA